MMQKKTIKDYSFEYMPIDQLSFIVFMVFNALALYQKTKHSRPGMGTAAQEGSLSYPLELGQMHRNAK